MGHAGLSTLLVLMLPILLAPLQATNAARVPYQDTAEDVVTTQNPCVISPLDDFHLKDCICNRKNARDPETASIIKAKLRESPDYFPFEEHMEDESFLDKYCNDPLSTSNSTTVTTTVSTTSDSTTVTTTVSTTSDSTTVTTTVSTTPANETGNITSSESTTITTSENSTISTSETTNFISSSTETSTESSTSEAPPDLDLYKETETELEKIATILDNFIALVGIESKAVHVESVASARRRWGHRDLPVAWLKRVKSSRPRADTDFCVDDSEVDTTTCIKLQTQLQETDDLVGQLTENVDDWHASDRMELTEQRKGLEATYEEAQGNSDFALSVNEQFTPVVTSVMENVQSGSTVVQEKIADLEDNTGDDNPGSIALVATLGSVGGLMVLSLIGVMIYGAVQKSKTKKKLSPKKAKNENIPIDAYSHDGPGRSPAKNDPYSAAPVPAPRNYHQPGHFDPRREPVYPEPVSGRPQQGLRRTNY